MQAVVLDHLPDSLLHLTAAELHGHLDGPTVFHLKGLKPEPLFVSVLQHGNETSGWDAVRRLLTRRYARQSLPRDLLLMVGNVSAAARGQRRLADQPDFNRCWPGSRGVQTVWHRLFESVTHQVRALRPFASIDIHNNTGQNPHYAAVNRIETRRLNLAAMFSRTVIYFTEPSGVQSMAFGEFCPAVTLECGLASAVDGTDHATTFLDRILNIESLPAAMPAADQLELYRVVATVTVDHELDFGFAPDGDDLSFPSDLDHFNFRELPPGTAFAQTRNGALRPLRATSHDGSDVSSNWFATGNGQIFTSRPLMPAMLTTDETIIRQDCLCYLMERIRPDQAAIEPVEEGTTLPETLP